MTEPKNEARIRPNEGLRVVLQAYVSAPNADGFMSYTCVECADCVFRYNGATLILLARAAVEGELTQLIAQMKPYGRGNGYQMFTMALPIEAVQRGLMKRQASRVCEETECGR